MAAVSGVLVRDGAVAVRDGRVVVGPCAECCGGGFAEILIRSLGVQDDDLRVKIGGRTVSDTRWNVGWYRGEHLITRNVPPFAAYTQPDHWRVIRLGRDALADARGGEIVEIDVFDGWGNSWATSPWVATVRAANGRTWTFAGGGAMSGASSGAMVNYYDMGDFFPGIFTVPGGGFYGEKIFGPWTYNALAISHSSDPIGADDDLVINGEIVFGNNFADLVNGGVTTTLAVIPRGQTLSVDLFNAGGVCGASGTLRIEADGSYFSTGPHFFDYIPNGAFVLPQI